MKQLPLAALAAALLLGAATAQAQTTFHLGLRGGLHRALTTTDPAGTSAGSYPSSYATEKSACFAWQAGVVLEARAGNLAVQPALLFSQKGEQRHTFATVSGVAGSVSTETTTTNRYNWLELPLNVVYTRHGDHGWQVFAGPYVALGVGGRQRGSAISTAYYGPATDPKPSTPQPINEAIAYGDGTTNRRLDAGVNFGLGYRQGPVQVQLGYGLGLRNLHQPADTHLIDFVHEFGADAAYNRVAQLTGTYFFN